MKGLFHAYARAHPDRRAGGGGAMLTRVISVTVADLGDAAKNRALDETVAQLAQAIGKLADDMKS